MEVIQLTALWSTFRDKFEDEKNMLEGALVEKAAEDLRQRISKHNVIVVLKNWPKITLRKLAQLLCLSIQPLCPDTCGLWLLDLDTSSKKVEKRFWCLEGQEGSRWRNVIVVLKYYSRITLRKLAQLLCLSIQEAEKHLSKMVVSKSLVGKIDLPMGVVCLQTAKESNDILNSWPTNLEKLLDLVDESCHRIHKQTVVHMAALRAWRCS